MGRRKGQKVEGYKKKGFLRGYQFELFPDYYQRQLLNKTIGHSRFVWNWALEEKQSCYANTGKSPSRLELSVGLVRLKTEHEWLKQVNSQALQAQLLHLEQAYSRFFKKQSKIPKRKKKKNGGSFSVPQNVEVKENKVYLPKINEGIVFDNHREINGNIRSATVSITPTNRYFVSFLVDDDSITPMPKTGKEIGIDLGLTSFIATSEGEKIESPKYLRRKARALARSQRAMARKTKGSNNREKARLRVAKLHNIVADQRRDFCHKLSTKLVKENDVIYCETLKSSNMMKNRKLAKSIGDAGWSMFVNMLAYKCDWYGKKLIKIGQFEKSTGVCSCGYKTKLELKHRTWICPQCGQEHDRDVQSAKIIKQIGHGIGRIHDCGDWTSTNNSSGLLACAKAEAVRQQGERKTECVSMLSEAPSFRRG